jgi:hypothetical protein
MIKSFCFLALVSFTCIELSAQELEAIWVPYEDFLVQENDPGPAPIWPNGQLRAEHKSQGDSVVRIQYYDDGTVQCECRVEKENTLDTVATVDADTFEELYHIISNSWYVPKGYCRLYHQNGIVSSRGFVDHFARVGKWLHYSELGKRTKLETYDSRGYLSGPYLEYYPEGHVKVEGNYANYSVIAESPGNMKHVYRRKEYVEYRKGLWRFYAPGAGGVFQKHIIYPDTLITK